MTDLENLLHELFSSNGLAYAVLSSPQCKTMQCIKIIVRPVAMKQGICYQVTEHRGSQAFHKNLSASECEKFLQEQLNGNYKQALFCTEQADYQVLNNKRQSVILKKPPTKKQSIQMHNRKKQYILEENAPFLLAIGLTTKSGALTAKTSGKFRQLNKFLEMIADILPCFKTKKKLHIIDFGCGKAYLTFALYHYLVNVKKYEVDIVGLDLKQEVITHCQTLAAQLGCTGLRFQVGDINHHVATGPVDMVISLHACDTATDAALEKAIRWNAQVILCAPCCQHELFKQIKNTALSPLLDHGILKERFSALATDAARVQLLEILGYQTQAIEFIDLEHTPKNLLIRAVKRKSNEKCSPLALQAYYDFKHALNITPSLERRFNEELQKFGSAENT